MKPETLERRIYKRIRKKGKVPWENLTDYPPNNIFQSEAAKKDISALTSEGFLSCHLLRSILVLVVLSPYTVTVKFS